MLILIENNKKIVKIVFGQKESEFVYFIFCFEFDAHSINYLFSLINWLILSYNK